MSGQTSRIEPGELLLPHEAPWLTEFERELLGFPGTEYADQIDALAHLLAWTARPVKRLGICGPRIGNIRVGMMTVLQVS